MTTGLEMMVTTLLLTHGLHTVTARKPTKTKRPGTMQTGKKIPRMGSRSFLRNSHTTSRPPFWMVSCKNDTTKLTLRSHCSSGGRRQSTDVDTSETVDERCPTKSWTLSNECSRPTHMSKGRSKDSVVARAQERAQVKAKAGRRDNAGLPLENDEPLQERRRAAFALDPLCFTLSRITPHDQSARNSTSNLVSPSMDKVYCEIFDTNSLNENNTTTGASVQSYLANPLDFGFSAASLQAKVVLDSGATCSTGAVDPSGSRTSSVHHFWQHGFPLNAQSTNL